MAAAAPEEPVAPIVPPAVEPYHGNYSTWTLEQLVPRAQLLLLEPPALTSARLNEFARLWGAAVSQATPETQQLLIPMLPKGGVHTVVPNGEDFFSGLSGDRYANILETYVVRLNDWVNTEKLGHEDIIQPVTEKVLAWQRTAIPVIQALLRARKAWWHDAATAHFDPNELMDGVIRAFYGELDDVDQFYQHILPTVLAAIQATAVEDNKPLNWREIWNLLHGHMSNAQTQAAFEPYVYTPAELAVLQARRARQVFHEQRIAGLPEVTLEEEAGLYIEALIHSDAKTAEEYAHGYATTLEHLFYAADTDTQADVLRHLPTLDQQVAHKWLRNALTKHLTRVYVKEIVERLWLNRVK